MSKTEETFNCPLCREDKPYSEVVRVDQWRICKDCNTKMQKSKSNQGTEKLSKKEKKVKETKQEKKLKKKVTKKLKKQEKRSVIYVIGDVKTVLSKAKKVQGKIDKVEKRKDRTTSRIAKLDEKIVKAQERLVKYTERQVKFAERITDAEFLEQDKVKALKVEKLGKTLDGGLRFYKNNKWHVVPPSLIGGKDDKGVYKAEEKKLVLVNGEIKEKKFSRSIARKIEEQSKKK